MEPSKGLEYKVGVFVTAGTLLFLAFILALGGDKAIFHRNYTLKMKIDETGGLAVGGIVQVAGLPAGNVSDVSFDQQNTSVVISLHIDQKFQSRITKGSTAAIQTQGALGDKYILIHPGPLGGEALKNGDFVEAENGGDLLSTLGKSGGKVEKAFAILDHLEKLSDVLEQKNFAGNLSDTVKHLKNITQDFDEVMASVKGPDPKNNKIKKAIEHLASIMEKIDKGQGTLGGLINDPTVHEDMKAILGGAKRSKILKYLIRQSTQMGEEDEGKSAPKK